MPRTHRWPKTNMRRSSRRHNPICDGCFHSRYNYDTNLSTIVVMLFFITMVLSSFEVANASSQDALSHNGGSAMAMAGDECVALAVDKRFGSGPQTVNISPRRIIAPHPRVMVALTGLEGDIITVSEELSIHASGTFSTTGVQFGFDDDDRNDDRITPRAISSLASHILYARRSSPFFCEPLIVGLERCEMTTTEGNDDDEQRHYYYRPYICSQDVIGAKSTTDDFACCGVAEKSLYGTAEAMWRPHLKPRDLVRICGRAFLSALERDCLSGYGAVVYLMTKDGGIIEFDLDCRND